MKVPGINTEEIAHKIVDRYEEIRDKHVVYLAERDSNALKRIFSAADIKFFIRGNYTVATIEYVNATAIGITKRRVDDEPNDMVGLLIAFQRAVKDAIRLYLNGVK